MKAKLRKFKALEGKVDGIISLDLCGEDDALFRVYNGGVVNVRWQDGWYLLHGHGSEPLKLEDVVRDKLGLPAMP